MKSILKVSGISVLLLASAAFTFEKSEQKAEKDAIKELVLSAYLNGAFNDLDADKMEKGFHEDFAIFAAKGEAIDKYPINEWVARVRKRKSEGYDASDEKNIWKHKFASVDVTGGAAVVQLQLINQGNLVYTDYLSLIKFESGWRIVAKVYHKH